MLLDPIIIGLRENVLSVQTIKNLTQPMENVKIVQKMNFMMKKVINVILALSDKFMIQIQSIV